MSLARKAYSATPPMPTTPSAQTDQQPTPNGSWRHPQFDEIARRQYATTFDERNVRAIVLNSGLLFVSVYGQSMSERVKLVGYAAALINAVVKAVPFSAWAILAIRVIFATNIVIAFLPLVRRYYPDDMADIPLTPSQRASMGLKADVHAPPTPGPVYASPGFVTPPRYQRSTPRSNSFSNQDYSPFNGSPRPNLGGSTSNSPFNLSGSAAKRSSYNSSMSSSLFGDNSSSVTPGTPTPSTGKASVGLNNKWLYEKRRDSPKSNLFL